MAIPRFSSLVRYLTGLLVLMLITVTGIQAQTHCAASGDCSHYFIGEIQFSDDGAGVTNISACSGYSDYFDDASLNVQVTTGMSYNVTVLNQDPTATSVENGNKLAIFADWNNDGTFDNSEGSLEVVGYTDFTKVAAFSINVPANVAPGKIRLRIRALYSGSIFPPVLGEPCGTASGEVEDYALIVSSPTSTSCATGLIPADSTFNLCTDSVLLAWNPSSDLTGVNSYKVVLGKNPPNYNDVLDSVGTVDTFMVVSGLDPGSEYRWTVVPSGQLGDAPGCEKIRFITGPGSPVPFILPQNPSVCAGEQVILDGNVSGGLKKSDGTFASHAWITDGWFIGAANLDTVEFDTQTDGFYEVVYRVVDSLGCSGTDTISVTVNPALNGRINNPVADWVQICPEEVLNVSGVGSDGTPDYTFTYTANLGTVTVPSPGSPELIEYTHNVSGIDTLFLKVRDAAGCEALDTLEIELLPALQPSIDLQRSPSDAVVCIGEVITFNADTADGDGAGIIQWFLDGNPMPALDGLLIWAPDNLSAGNHEIRVSYTPDECAIPSTVMATVQVEIQEAFQADLNALSSFPVDATICAGDQIDFTITHENPPLGGVNYTWKVNGKTTGPNSDRFSTQSLADDAEIRVVVTPEVSCGLPDSLDMMVSVTNPDDATIALTANPDFGNGGTICPGDEGQFTVNFTDVPNAAIEWLLNGQTIPGTDGKTTITVPGLNDRDGVTVKLTSPEACYTNFSLSEFVEVKAITPLNPQIQGIDVDGIPVASVCAGEEYRFTADTSGGGQGPAVQWILNGMVVESGTVEWTGTLVSGDQLQFVLTPAQCSVPLSDSATAAFDIITPPQKPGIVDNGDSTLSCTITGDAYRWYVDGDLLPQTGQTISVNRNGLYTVEVLTGDCASEPSDGNLVSYLSLQELSADAFKIYPNPSRGEVTVRFDGDTHVDVQLSNLLGQSLKMVDNVTSGQRIQWPELASGTYLLVLKTDRGTVVKRINIVQ